MNNGFVKIRRGILDHLVDGRISTNEFTVFMVLLLHADAGTGRGVINTPMLQSTFCRDLSSDTCQRVLAKLESKKYIWRLNPTAHKTAYHYWINKYECTRGVNEARLTCLSQVFETNEVKDIKYVDPATQVSDVVSAHLSDVVSAVVSADHHDSYKKETEKEIEKKKEKKTKATTVVSVPNVCFQSVPSNKEDVSIGGSPSTNNVCAQTVPPKRAYSVPSKPCAPREPELTVAQEEALAMQELAKEIARREHENRRSA